MVISGNGPRCFSTYLTDCPTSCSCHLTVARWDQRGPPLNRNGSPVTAACEQPPLTGQSDRLFMPKRLKKDNVCVLQSASCVSSTGKVVRQTEGGGADCRRQAADPGWRWWMCRWLQMIPCVARYPCSQALWVRAPATGAASHCS